MNILIINHYAGSNQMGMVFRPYYMAKKWTEEGHNVSIITSDYSHLRYQNPVVMKDWQTEFIDGIRYIYVKTRHYSGNGVNRAINMIQFIAKLMHHTNKIISDSKPDVVIASSVHQLDTYVAQKIVKKTGAVYIHEVSDMWPITLMELGGMSKYNPIVIMVQMAENSACRNCDYMVSLLEYSKDYFVEHGMDPQKFRHIPNGILKEEWETSGELPEKHKNALKEIKQNGKFIICFFGSHTKSYALDYLVDAVRETNEKNICVVFVGDGNQKNALMESTLNEKDQFIFLDPIPKQSIPALLREVDVLYVGAIHNDIFRFGISMNKLFDSMMSGKPILYASDAPNNYITEYDCGISVEPENVDSLKKGILSMYQLSCEDREKMGINGKKAALEHFEYSVLANQFLDVINEGRQCCEKK